MRLGIIVNPIAGIGGPMGLGGSDNISWLAELGVRGPSHKRAVVFLTHLRKTIISNNESAIELYVGEEQYGYTSTVEAGLQPRVTIECRQESKLCSRIIAEKMSSENVDLIVFFGGDGTAFDVAKGTRGKTPMIGVPCGTKMYNSIFVLSENHLSDLISLYLENDALVIEKDVFLIDEELLQHGIYKIVDKTRAKTIYSDKKAFFQESKDASLPIEDEEIESISKYLEEQYGFPRKGSWIMGPGRTIQKLLNMHGYSKQFLGFMGLIDGQVICHPCSSMELIEIINNRIDTRLVLTPIGGSGFLIGRGNKELTPRIVRLLLSKEKIIVVATKRKIRSIKQLLVDTGSREIDSLLEGYMRVVVGYYEEMVVKVLSTSKIDKE